VTPPLQRARPRDLGIRIGSLPSGPTDSIVDVAHVKVGHATVWRDEPPPPRGRGIARTGVTAVVPFSAGELYRRRVPAGASVLNGAGEAIGITTIEEWGVLETPILLTSSMSIGRVYDATIPVLLEAGAIDGDDDEAVMPVVTECDDGWLNTWRHGQIEPDDVRAAIADAVGAELGPVAGGAVGAGTGMVCFEMKGGIGTASRIVHAADRHRTFGVPGVAESGPAYTVGVLALANFGRIGRLTVDGVRVGETLQRDGWLGESVRDRERGSCVVVVATDAPLLGSQLERLARAPASGWRAPGPRPVTGPARSSSPSPRGPVSRAGTGPRSRHSRSSTTSISTRSSAPSSTPRRRPSSTPCSARIP